MRMDEAVKMMGTGWCRPVTWRGMGCAVGRVSSNGVAVLGQVPTRGGHIPVVLREDGGFLGEWEVVRPEEVLREAVAR